MGRGAVQGGAHPVGMAAVRSLHRLVRHQAQPRRHRRERAGVQVQRHGRAGRQDDRVGDRQPGLDLDVIGARDAQHAFAQRDRAADPFRRVVQQHHPILRREHARALELAAQGGDLGAPLLDAPAQQRELGPRARVAQRLLRRLAQLGRGGSQGLLRHLEPALDHRLVEAEQRRALADQLVGLHVEDVDDAVHRRAHDGGLARHELARRQHRQAHRPQGGDGQAGGRPHAGVAPAQAPARQGASRLAPPGPPAPAR